MNQPYNNQEMKLPKKIISLAAVTPMLAFAAGGHGVEKANLDVNTSPGTDFYQYACGG